MAIAIVGLGLSILGGEAAAQTRAAGTIEGRVELQSDRQQTPIRRARVTLYAEADGMESLTATDSSGRYRFERLAPGRYRIRAEKAGFVSMSSDARGPIDLPMSVEIKPGDALTVDLPMQRGAALEGRFLDDRGDPISNLTVSADRLVAVPDGRPRLDTRSATTNDLGRFRLHTLPPGQYYLHARPPPPASGDELYYPGKAGVDQATVLTLTAGQSLSDLDFTVATAPLSPIAADAVAAHNDESRRVVAPAGLAARIAGRITRVDTGQPLADATAQIQPLRGGVVGKAPTDAAGQFEFAGLSSGSYLLTATARGYVNLDAVFTRPRGAGIVIEVKEGEFVERANLVLAPPSAIEGRVLDEFGDPAPGLSLQLAQLTYVAGLSRFMPVARSVPTDDRGWFRLPGVFPGDYYLLAVAGAFSGSERGPATETPERAPSGLDLAADGADGFATTYFPGTDQVSAAAPVHVATGADTLDVTFNLVVAKMVTVFGVVTDITGRPVSNARLMLLPTDGGDVRTVASAMTVTDPNGAFRYRDVPEGAYVLQGFSNGLFGSVPLTGSATSVNAPLAVALTLRPRTTARGRIAFEGSGVPPRDPSSVRIGFQPTDFTSGPAGGNRIVSHVNEAWEFEILELAWKGVIQVNAPAGWALKSILLDGRDIADTPHDFQSADVNGLKAVLTSRVGAITGIVLDGERLATDVTVIVFGEDSATWTYPSRFLSVARTNQRGALGINGLLPGRYLAVAVPLLSAPQIDPAWLREIRPFATSIVVSEGSGTPLTLKMIRR